MKKISLLIALFLSSSVAFAAVELREEGVRVGVVEEVNFVGDDITVTKSGGVGVVTLSLSDYVSDSSLTTALSDYVSDSSLTTTLADYSKLVDTVVVGATDVTLVAADSGKIYVSGGNGTLTLPDAADGLNYRVVAGGAHTLNVAPASTADTIMYLTLDAGDKITSTGATADSVELVGDGENNKWYVVNMKGSWADGA